MRVAHLIDTARLDELCEFAPTQRSRAEVVYWFLQLVGWLRPRRGESPTARTKFLSMQLARKPEWERNVAATLAKLVEGSTLAEFFLTAGLPRDFHFLGAVRSWAARRVLPTPCDTDQVEHVVTLAFRESDLGWLRRSGALVFAAGLLDDARKQLVCAAVREAVLDVTHQLSAQAHASTLRTLRRDETSPFRGLYDQVSRFAADPSDGSALAAVHARVAQCVRSIRAMREELAERGGSLNTTFQVIRIRTQLQRLVALADALHQPSPRAAAHLFTTLVGASLRDARASQIVGRSTTLLVQNLVDTSAEVGREYLEPNHSSWPASLRAGLGGGVIMALATVVKLALARVDPSPFWEGVLFSANYAAAFCAAYLLHATIATKLPAHTAVTVAQCVQGAQGHATRLRAFVRIWNDLVRLQLGGLAGNLLSVVPVAMLLDLLVTRAAGHHVVTHPVADHLLAKQSVLGPSLLYAALTGVFLWMSSLIGAACENWSRLARVEASLATNVWTLRVIGADRGRIWARRIASRIGGLVGNASLGVLLGGVPAAFAIMGIPVEIRHVTVSAASVSIGYAAGADRAGMTAAVVGVVLIGAINVVVSFALSLWLAFRPATAAASARTLIRIGLQRWVGLAPARSA